MHCLAVIRMYASGTSESVELEESATGLGVSATRACRARRVLISRVSAARPRRGFCECPSPFQRPALADRYSSGQ